MRIVLTCVILLFGGTFALAQTLETSAGTATLTPMLTGLDEPWAIAHLPQDGNGAYLVTERDGGAFICEQRNGDQGVGGSGCGCVGAGRIAGCHAAP